LVLYSPSSLEAGHLGESLAVVAAGRTRTLGGLLFGVSAFDAFAWAGAAALLTLACLLASYVPARRAARVDPMAALRCE